MGVHNKEYVAILADPALSGETITAPHVRVASFRDAQLKKVVGAVLDARGELQLGTRVPDADVYMLSDGYKRSAKTRFLDAFRTSDGEKST